MSGRPEELYHVTVMPCYDKKLEAARDDFVFDLESHENGNQGESCGIPEVDSVLTTGEVLELIQVRNLYFLFLICLSFLAHDILVLIF